MTELVAWVQDERDTAQLHPLLVFFRRSLAEQVRRPEKKVEREKVVLATLTDLSLQIVEFARKDGLVTIGAVTKLTGGSRNTLTFMPASASAPQHESYFTLKQHYRNLVESGHLNQQGGGRGVWYELK